VIEWVPVMLFILGWHPDRPGELDLQRPEILFETAGACEEVGARMAEDMTKAARDKSGARYEHRCLPIPGRDEFDEAFKRLEKEQP